MDGDPFLLRKQQGRQDPAYRATLLLFIEIDLIDVLTVANFYNEDSKACTAA